MTVRQTNHYWLKKGQAYTGIFLQKALVYSYQNEGKIDLNSRETFDSNFVFLKQQAEATDFFTDKYCPALELHLWRCLVDYSHIEPTINSSLNGFQVWKKIS